jgi:hypothetical protein
MKSFHNDPKIKEKYLARVKRHREADNLIRGIGWFDGRGCAVGCTLESYDHSRYEVELGIPEWLARAEDVLFEGIPKEDAMEWPERFLKAIPIGVDLEQVKAPFLIFMLESNLEAFDHCEFPECKKAVDDVIALYRSGETDKLKYRTAARAAVAVLGTTYTARIVSASAADAAYASSDAAYAASATVRAIARATDAAAYTFSRTDGAAHHAYRTAACKKFADKLIDIFESLEDAPA